MSEHIETVQVRMRPNTIEQVNKIQGSVHAPSRSDAVRRAVEIADLLINAVEEGDQVLIKKKNGEQTRILISGLSK